MSLGKLPSDKNFFNSKKLAGIAFKKINNFDEFIQEFVASCQVRCGGSQGERLCAQRIAQLYPTAQMRYEVTLKTLSMRRYDLVFYLPEQQRVYFLEFDGSQHFEKKHLFYKSDKNAYTKCRNGDCQKTLHILQLGFPLIRIDWDSDHLIREHIETAVNATNDKRRYYRSSPIKYKYISTYLNKNF
jgi:hypothetical protein